MRLYVGIEGLSMRQSVAAMATQDGNIVAVFLLRETPLSLHTTPEPILLDRISKLLTGLCSQPGACGLSELRDCVVCIGLTGVTFRYHRHICLPRLLAELDLFDLGTLVCTGDVEIAFAAGTIASRGSAVLCHCGSTAYAVTDTDGRMCHYRVGGWGPVFGDDGSGFWMGHSVLRELAHEHDMHQPASVLWKELHAWLETPQPTHEAWIDASQRWQAIRMRLTTQIDNLHLAVDERTLIYHFAHTLQQQGLDAGLTDLEGIESWRQVASGFVMPLMAACAKGDQTAKRIVDAAISSLCRQHIEATDLARRESGASCLSPLFLWGGVISHNALFRNLLRERLREIHGDNLAIVHGWECPLRPVCGALLFALGGSKTENLRLPSPDVVARVVQSSSLFPGLKNG
jgi:N-acetylglucosamine kinase-like BadF-type ATPase